MASRLPAHIEVSGLLRAVETAGGFATVLAKGERDAGTILVVCCENGKNSRIFERMTQANGKRLWMLVKYQDTQNPEQFSEYLQRRRQQDSDIWIVELDIPGGERFIGESSPGD